MKKTKTEIEKQSFWIILASFPLALIAFAFVIGVLLLLLAFVTMPLWLPVVLILHIF